MKTQTSAGFPDPASAPRVETVEVSEDRHGQRLDNFLTGRLKGVPKSHVYRLLRTGQVRVNGKRAKPDYRIAAGDAVRIPPVRMGEPADHGTPPEAESARVEAAILAEDRDFIVIDKPSGVASHGGSGVSFGAIELMRAARPDETLELVHRLDRDTSGVLVLAKRRSALTALQAEIRAGRVEKRYLALLVGALPQSRLSVDAPLLKSVLQGGERMVRVDDAGKASRSRFAEVERFGNATLAEVAIETGRTHQIRVHAAHIGHAVAGDEKYGDKTFNGAVREAGLKRLFLHAARFEFSIGERAYAFSAPLPDDLKAVLDALSGGARGAASVRNRESEPRARVRAAPKREERSRDDDSHRESEPRSRVRTTPDRSDQRRDERHRESEPRARVRTTQNRDAPSRDVRGRDERARAPKGTVSRARPSAGRADAARDPQRRAGTSRPGRAPNPHDRSGAPRERSERAGRSASRTRANPPGRPAIARKRSAGPTRAATARKGGGSTGGRHGGAKTSPRGSRGPKRGR